MTRQQSKKSPQQARLNNATHDLFRVMQIIASERGCDNLKTQLAISSGGILAVSGLQHKMQIISEMREGFDVGIYQTSDQVKKDVLLLSTYFLRAHLFSQKENIDELNAKIFLGKIKTAIFAMIGAKSSKGLLIANIINF